MPCEAIILDTCNGSIPHTRRWKCHQNPPNICDKCERLAHLVAEKQRKAHELQVKRDADKLAHERAMAALDEEIAAHAQALQDARISEEREEALEQKKEDLRSLNTRASGFISQVMGVFASNPWTAQSSDQSASDSTPSQQPVERTSPISLSGRPQFAASTSMSNSASASVADWERQKNVDGANSVAMDSIMDMVGLEDVKAQALRIKAKIEVVQRQGTDLKEERLNTVFLGNPGTGICA